MLPGPAFFAFMRFFGATGKNWVRWIIPWVRWLLGQVRWIIPGFVGFMAVSRYFKIPSSAHSNSSRKPEICGVSTLLL